MRSSAASKSSGRGAARLVGPAACVSPQQKVGRFSVFRIGTALTLAIWLSHVIALPLGISYDGHVYIELADILGSSRFPAEWNPLRTPLFPLTLKVSFLLFGRQPLAAILASAVPALLGILATGLWVRRLAGPAAAAGVMIVLSLFPTLIAYQHMALTETGTFFFISAALAVSICLRPRTSKGKWSKALILGMILAGGFLWRQNLLSLTPVFALSPFLQNGRQQWRSSALHALVILLIPAAVVQIWKPYSGGEAVTRIMVRYGIGRQALLPADDPMIADRSFYLQAIRDSMLKDGSFYSGLQGDLTNAVVDNVIRWTDESPGQMLRRLVVRYPYRYISSVWRTTALLAGAPARQRENKIFREQILSEELTGSRIGEGPSSVDGMHRQQFRQQTTNSAVGVLLRKLSPAYDLLTPVAVALTCLALFLAAYLKNSDLLVVGGTPVFYVLPYALSLTSVDRYGFPMHPVCFAGAVATCAVIGNLIWRRSVAGAGTDGAGH